MRQQEGLDAHAARVRFGNPRAVHEQMRAAGILVGLESLVQDVRYGLRQMRRAPLLTTAIVVSLAVGIGANAAIFALVDAALLKSLPVRDPASLVVLEWTSAGWPQFVTGHTGSTFGQPSGPMRATSVAPDIHRRLVREQMAFTDLIGFSDGSAASLAPAGRPAEQVNLQYASHNFFQALGVVPVRGRAFAADDDRVGGEPVLVISHRFWQKAFGGRDDAIGDTVRVNGVMTLVVGVAPPGFFGVEIGEWVDAYAPLAARVVLTPRPPGMPAAEDGTIWWVRQIGRLRAADDGEAATRQLDADFRRIVVPDGVTIDAQQVPTLVSVSARRGFDPVGGDTATALWALLLLVGLVLLIVCTNVANLLLARAVARQREVAVRLALGAGGWRLVRQSLVESGLLVLIGAALGLYAGYLLAGAIHALVTEGFSTRALDLRIDARVAGFTAAIALLTALVFGLAPALRLTRGDPHGALQTSSRTIVAGHLRLPRMLVAAQIALCLTVLVTASLLGRSLTNLREVDVGFERDNLVYVSVNPWRAGMQAEQVGPYVDRLRAHIAAVPGVRQVATIAARPLSGSTSSGPANVPGRPFREDGSNQVLVNELGEGGLETLGIRVLSGRTLAARDMRAGAEAVLVDEHFVQHFFPDRYALGQRFGLGRESSGQYEIVGIVQSSRYHSLRTGAAPIFYRPHVPAERRGRDIHVAVRVAGDVSRVAPMIRRAAAEVDSGVPIGDLATQAALIDRLLTTERLLGLASAAFGAVALVLAAVGLAGLLGYMVARRRSEIGVRMVLGAAPGDIAGLIVRDCLRLVAMGIGVGIPAAWAVSRGLDALLYGVALTDPAPVVLSLAVLLAVAALAAWVPARRAAAVDPLVTLRSE
jgi:putative ABC transport system permease protein